MRRCVFLAVLLSLALGLLEETGTEPTSSVTPTSSPETGTEPTSSVTPTSSPANFCSSNPCGQSFAKCVSLYSNYTCQCEYGYYYSNENCYKGKVFPVFVGIKEQYNPSVENVNSPLYEDVLKNLRTFFGEAFKTKEGYVGPVIVEIQPLKASRDVSQMNVTVTNLFWANSTVTSNSVYDAIKRTISNTSYVSSYEVARACDVFQCDTQTTECVGDTPECKCKNDLEKTKWDERSCSVCSKNCSAEAKKYCAIEKGVPTCKCMTNYESKDGKCVACPVGYSGVNCKDSTELILIIVGSVFGAIILSLVIALTVVSSRAKHKQSTEQKSLMKSGYSNTNIPDDRPSMMFPRVQTTSGHANPGYQPNNPYDMHPTNRGHFSGRNYDDLYDASREPRGYRMQNRY